MDLLIDIKEARITENGEPSKPIRYDPEEPYKEIIDENGISWYLGSRGFPVYYNRYLLPSHFEIVDGGLCLLITDKHDMHEYLMTIQEG
jgi:hypothetical protein